MPSEYQTGASTDRPSPPRGSFTGNGHSGLRTPSLDNTTYILVLLVVLIPIIFTILLCAITYCIYRYNKSRSDQAPTNCRIAFADRSAPVATIIYNTQHSPFIFEESPPSYDSLADIKKNSHGTTTNTDEQFPLTILPNTTLTNPNQEVTAAAVILPSAPPISSSLPPSYVNLHELNK